jgi:uncharacterized protein (DUF433 family)
MPAIINGHARIEGTRITVYDVLTYSEAGWQPSSIAATLGLSTAQVQAVLEYISENREEVLRKYHSVLARIAQGNPPEVEARRQRSHDRLSAKLKEIERSRQGG